MDFLIPLTMQDINRYEIVKKLIEKEISEKEAMKLMGLKSVRQVRRIKKRVTEKGAEGIPHRNRGKRGNRRLDEELVKQAVMLVAEKYSDFKPTFAAEKLLENYNIRIGRETLRKLMADAGLWRPKPRKQPKDRHVWRERKDNYGEMQQFDGSYHRWLEDRYGELCLLLAIDDATGKITKAEFGKNEGTAAVFSFWLEYFEKNGLPLSIYLDKFSTYKINHPSVADNKDLMTQFQRAMNQAGVQLINANSPEAKGRVERVFQTLQDRLVKEMRLAGIADTEEANEFLKTYIPEFNKQFAVVPEKQADLHKKVSEDIKKKLPQIFSVQSERRVNNDYTVMFKNRFYQLGETQPVTVFKKDTVIMEEHLTGEIKIRLKEKTLNYIVLPERPLKIKNIPLAALTNRKPDYRPPADHPWRSQSQSFPIKRTEKAVRAITPAPC